MAKLLSVGAVSNEDVLALPVKELGPAVGYYESVLAFTTARRDATTAVLERDDVRIGLVVQGDHRPEEAGSVAFEVDDLDALHRELTDRGGQVGLFGAQSWGGKRFRTFFAREDENGYCYCFYCPME
jgi:predicted enzyme related to lactoylglutathione lyase